MMPVLVLATNLGVSNAGTDKISEVCMFWNPVWHLGRIISWLVSAMVNATSFSNDCSIIVMKISMYLIFKLLQICVAYFHIAFPWTWNWVVGCNWGQETVVERKRATVHGREADRAACLIANNITTAIGRAQW